jgi:hypothetical protein
LCLCLHCLAFRLFVFSYNTQHKHPCPRRDSNPLSAADPRVRPLGYWDWRDSITGSSSQ